LPGTPKGLTYKNANILVGDFLDFIVDSGLGVEDPDYTKIHLTIVGGPE